MPERAEPLIGTHGYPRPQLQRTGWTSLNGEWDFAIDRSGEWHRPDQVEWSKTIVVPFAPETPASRVNDQSFFQACWYRRRFTAPLLAPSQRLILHFGAVDYSATVWCNGHRCTDHTGGYTPFQIDLTDLITAGREHEIIVRARDDPHDLAKPRGKQDWLLEPHSIWYPRTSGIWQTVWYEIVHESHIGMVRWTPNLERWEIGLDAHIDGPARDDLRLQVRLHVGDMVLADDSYLVIEGEVSRRIALSDPGVDDYRNELLWGPQTPTLIDVDLELVGAHAEVLDSAYSYTALRSIGIQGSTVVLNGRPQPLRLVLDQGYWPESGLTPPDDAALYRDVQLVKRMGFNGVRKHQKIEDPRYLYWADVLGLLVWEEMPSPYRFTKAAVERLTTEWIAAVNRDYSHPCIMAWVPFNESWGVPNLPDIPAERYFVEGLYCLTKTLDPTRPVVGNDGWESVATDIVGIHDYDEDPAGLARRYEGHEVIPHLFKRERPGGRLLSLDGVEHQGQPIMLTEFGGIAFSPDPQGTWGHSRATSADQFAAQYRALVEIVRDLTLLAGFCYTQFADTYQETNGLLYADRTPKFAISDIESATRGPRSARQEEIDRELQTRIRRFQLERGVSPPPEE
ncbi:MAG: glycoside hydrolase family 2 protein [Candidatus Binatia bacterium]